MPSKNKKGCSFAAGMAEPTKFNWEAFWEMDHDESAAKSPDKHLLAHYGLWLDGRPGQRVMVPLCGRSYDMLWLYQQGHVVTGCELVEAPVRRFFADHQLPHEVTPWECGLRFRTTDGRLTVFQGDLLRLDVVHAGLQDAVLDVASLQEIAPVDRARYGQLMRSLLTGDFRYLVYCTQHEHPTYSGPPYSVTADVIESTFGGFCCVKQLFPPEPDTEFNEPAGSADPKAEHGGEEPSAADQITDPNLQAAYQAMLETVFYKCMYLLTPKH